MNKRRIIAVIYATKAVAKNCLSCVYNCDDPSLIQISFCRKIKLSGLRWPLPHRVVSLDKKL